MSRWLHKLKQNIKSMVSNSRTFYEQARQAMDQGDLEEAVALFEQSVSASLHFKSLELLGECLSKIGRKHEAIVALAAATTLNEGVRAPALLAQVFLEMGNYREAYDFAELALSRHSSNRLALQVKEAAKPHLVTM